MLQKQKAGTKMGFTLIELIVVLVILGILAALAIPTFNAIRNRGGEQVAESSATNVASSATSLWALYDGKPAQTKIEAGADDVTCQSLCTRKDVLQAALNDAGIPTSGADVIYVLSGDADAPVAKIIGAANTDNMSCAEITFANQTFTAATLTSC